MLQPKLPRGEQGFTLTEMLVAMLITSMFVALTMQAVVIAAIFKARTEQYDQAITWIQEDSELVINQSSEYEKNAYPYSSKCNAAVAADGLAAGFASLLNDPTGIGDTFKIDGPRTFGGKAFILTRTAVYATSYNPFKLLEITYIVAPQSGTAIATISTEVIADAAFRCP